MTGAALMAELGPGRRISYADAWYGPQWTRPEAMILVHGIAEWRAAWTQWVPPLAGRFRVLRPDLPGYGQSTPPADRDYGTPALAAALVAFMDRLDLDRVHLVGAKYGASVAIELAAAHPDRVRSLSLMGAPINGARLGGGVDFRAAPERVRSEGVRAWAHETQRARLGADAPEAQLAWWSDVLMAAVDRDTCHDSLVSLLEMDIEDRLPLIQAPTLMIGAQQSSVQPMTAMQAGQRLIPNARLIGIPGNCYHVAAVYPERCAAEVLAFVDGLG